MRGCAPTSAPASARSIPARRRYHQPDFRAAGRDRRDRGRVPLPLALRRPPRRTRATSARCPAAEVRAIVDALYASRTARRTCPPRATTSGRSRCCARHARAAWTASPAAHRRASLRTATPHDAPRYYHPGYAAPIGEHVMPIAQVRAGRRRACAARPACALEAPAPVAESRPAARAHAESTSTAVRDRRAARARRVAEVSVVAGALSVGAA